MNNRTRARFLQRESGLTYQQALTFIREFGFRSVRIRKRLDKRVDLREIDMKLFVKLQAKGDFSPKKRRHNAKSKSVEAH
jgi:hypothetical protein